TYRPGPDWSRGKSSGKPVALLWAETQPMTILATGAAGKFAGLVVPALVRRGGRVRGLVHKPDEEETARRNGAAEVMVADLKDRATLDVALRGVEAIFYIAPAFMPDEADVG